MHPLARLLSRVLWAVPTLFAVFLLTFVLLRAAPGGPFDAERQIAPYIKEQLLKNYRLDGPVHEQFGWYLWDVMRGDLRLSTKYRDRTVNEILAQTLPVSLTVGAFAFVIALSVGTLLGVVAAAHHNGPADYFGMFVALAGISVPSFVLAPLLIGLFSFQLGWFPVGGWGAPNQIVLPALALGLPFAASIARLVRASMLEALQQDYTRTARAKGLPESRVLFVHALRNAALPLVSYAGPLAANILTGSLVVETIFRLPGVGPFFVNGVLNRDVFVVGGVTLVYSALLIAFNILVDWLYTVLDKRIAAT